MTFDNQVNSLITMTNDKGFFPSDEISITGADPDRGKSGSSHSQNFSTLKNPGLPFFGFFHNIR